MTETEAKAEITGRLIEACGYSEGLRTAGVTAAPIVGDFMKMIRAAGEGAVISEEYNMEDGSASLYLAGVGGRKGIITSVELRKRQ